MDGATKILSNFAEELREFLEEVKTETYEAIDRGLDQSMNYLKDRLAAESPIDSGLTKDSWVGTDQYKNVRYINNTRMTGHRDVKDPQARTANMGQDGIPVVNLLEFGKKGKPFLRKTVEREREKVFNIIKSEVENGSTE